MIKLRRILCTFLLLISMSVYSTDFISEHVPDAEEVGSGRLNVFLWDVYDATLYSPEGKWQSEKPFALKLSYLMSLKGKKIADRSVEEIRAQGFNDELILATWHAQMSKIFPDVAEGESLTGVYTQTKESIFYLDDKEIGRIRDPEFAKAFFNIWLGKDSSEPALREKLLGSI